MNGCEWCGYVGNPKKVSHLVNLEGAKERLHLFKADLLEEGSFDSAVEGCHAVFHTASPVRFVVNNPQVLVLFLKNNSILVRFLIHS